MKNCITPAFICALAALIGGCVSTGTRSQPSVKGRDPQTVIYLLEVTFEWGAGENPYRKVQIEVEVAREFYVRMEDRSANYHAIQGTLEKREGAGFRLPLHYANWTTNGGVYGTMVLDLQVGQSWRGGSNAGGYEVRLLPLPEGLSVEPCAPANPG